MLKFWKKPDKHSSQRPTSVTNPNAYDHNCIKLYNTAIEIIDPDEFDTSIKRQSRLPKTLNDILCDKSTINYLMQMLESRQAGHILRCYQSMRAWANDDCDKDNALNTFRTYLAKESQLNILVSEAARERASKILLEDDRSCFNEAIEEVYDILNKDHFPAFLTSDLYAKLHVDILTSGQAALEDILLSETALFYFMEFVEQEGGKHLLEFWIAANNFQEQLKGQETFLDPIEAQSDAVLLYDKYFSLQAHNPLGLSDMVRLDLEQKICAEDGGLSADCFRLSLRIVEQILERQFLPAFLGSQLFYKYLSELINSVECCGNATNTSRSTPTSVGPTASNCSDSSVSESIRNDLTTIGAQQDYLALQIPFHQSSSYIQSNIRPRMRISMGELFDPDAIWRRKKSSLSCGRITELGKFETDLMVVPPADSMESKLKSAMRRFVTNGEEDRRKEEMAWQVAEMIVKDITSVTLSDSNTST